MECYFLWYFSPLEREKGLGGIDALGARVVVLFLNAMPSLNVPERHRSPFRPLFSLFSLLFQHILITV